MSKSLDPNVPGPSKAFGQYDLSPTTDRCINCETQQKIMGTITIGKPLVLFVLNVSKHIKTSVKHNLIEDLLV